MHQLPHLHSWFQRESGISQIGVMDYGRVKPPLRKARPTSRKHSAHELNASCQQQVLKRGFR